MQRTQFTVEIDGRRVCVDPASQQVTVVDEAGKALFSDRIQVAAGSVQGLFSMVEDAAALTQPFNQA